MKAYAFFIFLLFILKIEAQNYVSNNGCFYSNGRTYSKATEITKITLTVSPLNFATCCDLCRALPDCILWYWDLLLATCLFYKDVGDIDETYNYRYYSGKKTDLPTWKCNEIPNKWYYDSQLNWVAQTAHVNSANCCEACFSTAGCVSYMFNSNSMTCYHSTKNFATTLNVVDFLGMSTGAPTISLTP